MKMNNIRYKAPVIKKNPCQTLQRTGVASYRTSDLYLSAFLKSKGIILQGTEKETGKVIFIFQNEGNIQDLINKYFNDSDVGVLRYKAALGDLRSIIFDYQNLMKKHREKRIK